MLLGKGISVAAVAEQLAVSRSAVSAIGQHPRLSPLRARVDQDQAVTIARKVLGLEASGAAAWALRIRAMPQGYMVFRSPLDAETVMAPLRSLLTYRLELETKSAKRWGEWSKPAHVILSGKDRLTVQPVSPAGIKGMALLKQAAEIVLRVGSGRAV